MRVFLIFLLSLISVVSFAGVNSESYLSLIQEKNSTDKVKSDNAELLLDIMNQTISNSFEVMNVESETAYGYPIFCLPKGVGLTKNFIEDFAASQARRVQSSGNDFAKNRKIEEVIVVGLVATFPCKKK